MEWILATLIEYAEQAHWVIFGALMLAGLHLPVSEDAVAILAGVLASQVVPENSVKLYLFLFVSAYLSDWLAYWVGRWAGPALWRWSWFRRIFRQERYDKLSLYYEKYGVATLLIGRMIPFGVRNGLFLTAGMAKMALRRFLWADLIACFTTVTVTFAIGYLFASHYERIFAVIKRLDILLLMSVGLAVIGFFCYKRLRKRQLVRNESDL